MPGIELQGLTHARQELYWPQNLLMKQVWFLLEGLIQLPIFEAHLSILSL